MGHLVYSARMQLWREPIATVEVDKATESSVWIRGKRTPRRIEDRVFCDTFEQAQQAIFDEIDAEVAKLEEQIGKLKARRAQVEALVADGIPHKQDRY